jgi:hypothetical protein
MTDTPENPNDLLTLPLDEIKRLAHEHGYHVTAVADGYKVQLKDEIGGPDENTDYDLSFTTETEEQAYAAIREQLWQRADIKAWIAKRKTVQRLN